MAARQHEIKEVLGHIQAVLNQKAAQQPRLPPPVTTDKWPVSIADVYAWRAQQLRLFEQHPNLIGKARAYYKSRPEEFINHWCDTYDPRPSKASARNLPFVMFTRQAELCQFVCGLMQHQCSGLVEKARDMGATYVCIGISVWLWLFHPGTAIGWGSASAAKVDKLGDPSTIFEKMRMMIRRLPPVFKPKGFEDRKHMMQQRLLNPDNLSSIVGEIGPNIGRGGRTSIYFVDEAAHIERPEEVEASLSETTRVRIDISSVSGLGTIFHRTRQSGVEWEPKRSMSRTHTNVFIMDWSQHPAKTKAWHKERKEHFTSKGLPHVFAREIERNYGAAVEGVVIPAEWVEAAIDAHKTLKLGANAGGGNRGGLDVADGGRDQNGIALGEGIILKHVNEWVTRDTGVTTREAISALRGFTPIEFQYDCIGVGAGVKSEVNRLKDDDTLAKGVVFVAWNAGGQVLNPYERLIPGDDQSPLNIKYFSNLKAQAWWMTRIRFEKTWRAINEGIQYPAEELISIDSKSVGPKMLIKIKEQLSQPLIGQDARMRMMVKKTPDGTLSPNIADAIIMAYWPIPLPIYMTGGVFAAPIIVTGGQTG